MISYEKWKAAVNWNSIQNIFTFSHWGIHTSIPSIAFFCVFWKGHDQSRLRVMAHVQSVATQGPQPTP